MNGKSPLPEPRPEIEVLLRAIRSRGATEQPDPRLEELLRTRLFWTRLREEAIAHRLLPLLYRTMLNTPGDLVPPGELALLQSAYLLNARHSLRFAASLIKILRMMEEHGIPCLPLKGPVLAETAYGDVTLRQFGDLDLLVRPENLAAIFDLLASSGFSLHATRVPPRSVMRVRSRRECTFASSDPVVYLDVHWLLGGSFIRPFFRPDLLWARRRQAMLLGHSISALDPYDTLTYLCLHGTQHMWAHLGLVSDVAFCLSSRKDWDWNLLLERAGMAGLRATVILALGVAHDLTGYELPPVVERALADRADCGRLRAETSRRLLQGHFLEDPLRANLMMLGSRDSLRDKLELALERTFYPTLEDLEATRLPNAFFFVHYPLRPVRVFCGSIQTAVRKALGNSHLNNPK